MKRQASDTGEKIKSAAKDAKKQVEKQSEGLGDKIFSILNDVKNSIFGKWKREEIQLSWIRVLFLETIGLASKTAADVTDQAKAKLDEVSGKAKKTAEKAKKKVKDAVDL